MFDRFRKTTEPYPAKIRSFTDWFCANQVRIVASMTASDRLEDRMVLLDEVEVQLKLAFSNGYRSRVEFNYGYDEAVGKWNLNLFHFRKPFLVKATGQIAEILNDQLAASWYVMTAK